MREALSLINYETMQIKSSVSSAILGRGDIDVRTGMIFWAYDIGEKKIAKELMKFVMKLLSDRAEKIEEETKYNIDCNIELCYQIDYKLQLGVLNNVTLKGLLNRQLDIIKYKYKEYKFWRK